MRNGPVVSVVQLFVSILRQYRILLIIAIGGTARVFSQKPNTVSVTSGDFPDKVRFFCVTGFVLVVQAVCDKQVVCVRQFACHRFDLCRGACV